MREVYLDLIAHFSTHPDVETPGPKGAQGLKYGGKMFAMFYKGNLTVKLSPDRVQAIIDSGDGEPHDPGTGKPMKDRVLIPAGNKNRWIEYCEESVAYVKK